MYNILLNTSVGYCSSKPFGNILCFIPKRVYEREINTKIKKKLIPELNTANNLNYGWGILSNESKKP